MHDPQRSYAVVAGTILVLASSALLLFYKWAKKRAYWHSEFICAGKVDQLFLYPIKSCKGMKVPWLDCAERGCNYNETQDRRFLVVDANHDHLFLTARTHPKLVLIEACVEVGEKQQKIFSISLPDRETPIRVDLNEVLERADVRKAYLHKKTRTDGYDCGEEIARALTEFLGVNSEKYDLRLIYFTDELYTERDFPSKMTYWNNPVPEVNDKIAYMDMGAYMAFSSASVDDLKEHLKTSDRAENASVDARNFRPNIIVSGLQAYDEDRWLRVRIGEAEFVCYRPCTRCVLTTVDPDYGVMDVNNQPLRELRNYRLAPEGKLFEEFGRSPVFGVIMALTKPGRIHQGQDVWIQYKPSPF